MLFHIIHSSSKLQSLSFSLLAALVLCACAGPTTPFGGLNPWDLHQPETVEISSGLETMAVAASPAPVDPQEQAWRDRKGRQNAGLPWVLMDPEEMNYTSPMTLRIYIHDPSNHGARPKLRLTYDDWSLTSKIRNKKYWKQISDSDWEFTSPQIKFSPARVGELKVSFLAHQSKAWVGTKLIEPRCVFGWNDQDQVIGQTGRFLVDPALVKKIESFSETDSINPNLVAGLIAQESGFNPRAVSMSRALGLTQVTPVAEKEIVSIHPEFPQFPGLNRYSFLHLVTLIKMDEIGPDQEWRLDPDQSIRGGITYLSMVRDYWSRFAQAQKNSRQPAGLGPKVRVPTEEEQVSLILASYNSGPARVKRAYLQDSKYWLKDENLSEARNYVHKISSYCVRFRNEASTGKGQ